MITVEDVARQVIAAVDADVGYLLACRWVAARYQQLCSRSRFRHLRRVSTLRIPASIRSGTVEVENGSSTVVTTDADTLTAWQALPAAELVGQWFRAHIVWYEIIDAQVGAASATIKLRTPYTESTNYAAAYQILPRLVALPQEVRWLGAFMIVSNRNIALTYMPHAELDVTYPRRSIVSGFGPTVWSEVGVNENGQRLIEFYPYSTVDQTIGYVYWLDPPLLTEKDYIPQDIDGYILREGALIDMMRYLSSKFANEGNNEMAAFWTNSYRAQSTAWERNIIEAIRNDRGVDDVTLILRTTRSTNPVLPRDIVSASDEIYVRGGRP